MRHLTPFIDDARQTIPSHFFKLTGPVSRQAYCRVPSIHRGMSISRQTSCRAPSIHRRMFISRQTSCRVPSIHRRASNLAANIPSCTKNPAPRIQHRRKHPVACRAFSHTARILSKHPVGHGAFSLAAGVLSSTDHPASLQTSRLAPRIRLCFEHSVASTNHVTISRGCVTRSDHVAFWWLLVQYTPRR